MATSSTAATLPFNLTLGEESGTWMYTPLRDGNVTQGWNSSYTGSTVWSGGAGIGQPFRRTQRDEAGLWLNFEGTALYLCVSTLNGAGYNFSVDGQAFHKLAPASDPACSAFLHDPNHGPQTLLVADGLPYGTHTAKLNATIPNSQSLFEFYGGVVSLGAKAPADASIASTPVTIDDRDSRWSYQPKDAWFQDGSPQNVNGTHTYTCEYSQDASASFTFNGTSVVQVIGIEAQNTFGYTVQLTNHNTGAYNASNDWWTEGQTMYFADNLDPSSSYTITISNFNPNQPNVPPGTQSCFNLDALLLYQPVSAASSSSSTSVNPASTGAATSSASSAVGADSHSGSSSSSSSGLSGGAIAGIVLGVAGLVAIIAALFLILWHRRQQALRKGIQGVDLNEAGSDFHAPSMHAIGGLVHPTGPEPTPYVIPPPAAPERTQSTSTSSNGPYRNEKSARQLSHAPSSSASYLLPRSPGQASSSNGGASSPTASTTRLSTVTSEMLQSAATVDLVTALNARLRSEQQADIAEEPPMYGEHGP